MIIAQDDGRRRGAAGNFAWLLEEAKQAGADYVLLADQDDVWHVDKVARQVEALREAEAESGETVPHLVYCDAAVVDAARRPLHPSFLRHNRLPHRSAAPLKTLLGRSFVLGCACAVNRPLMELALPVPKVAASHDWWLALCAATAGRIACLDAALLEYRRHAANASQAVFWDVLAGQPAGMAAAVGDRLETLSAIARPGPGAPRPPLRAGHRRRPADRVAGGLLPDRGTAGPLAADLGPAPPGRSGLGLAAAAVVRLVPAAAGAERMRAYRHCCAYLCLGFGGRTSSIA